MNINKAIKKQEKSHKRFLLILGFIFFVLPFALFVSGKFQIFLIIYLSIIESLVLITGIISNNNNYLTYIVHNFRLKIKLNKFGDGYIINCDKVAIVHCDKQGEQMELILITNSKFRNKKIKEMDCGFLKRYPYMAQEYLRIKRQRPEENYFYIVITKGGYKKYELLDVVYRNCLQAHYTDWAVDRIKEYRNL